jgi:hypothetical protein
MSLPEVKKIVKSCLSRGIRFDIIELTGGEPSLWKNIAKAVPLLNQITESITLVTNGNDPELIMSLGLKGWGVSGNQATDKQIEMFEPVKDKVFINTHPHKKVPSKPIPDSLPADCCVRNDPDRNPFQGDVNSMMYLRGKVYYCNCAFSLSGKVPLNENTVCDFKDDFVLKYVDKAYDQEMCKYCLCNSKVWNQLA